jgi:hypothetical protein
MLKRALNYLAIAACWFGIFGMAYVGLVLA